METKFSFYRPVVSEPFSISELKKIISDIEILSSEEIHNHMPNQGVIERWITLLRVERDENTDFLYSIENLAYNPDDTLSIVGRAKYKSNMFERPARF